MLTNQIKHVNIGTLFAHPLNKKLYGSKVLDKSFFVSMREIGQLEPITILKMALGGEPKTYVLSGHRRFLAAKQLGWKTIEAREADVDPTDLVKVEQYLIEANRQRPKSWEQRGREFKELWRIEIVFAKQRRAATLKQGPKAPVREIFPQRGGGKARDIAAEKSSLNLSGRAAANFVEIIDAADAKNENARTALDAINANTKTISRAYRELFPKTAAL